ncbi:hypothetical protein ACFSLT_29455 [Novosphingobium resinovorum]
MLNALNVVMVAEPAAEGKEDLVRDKGPECCGRDGRRVCDQATVDHDSAQHDHRLALDARAEEQGCKTVLGKDRFKRHCLARMCGHVAPKHESSSVLGCRNR